MSEVFRFTGSLDDPATDQLWEFGCEGLWQDGAEVVASFPERLELPVDGTWEAPDEEDYLQRYFESLQPVYLTHLVIAPTHTEVTLKAGQKPLWLDPGMAFGTGHHETTRLALRALESLDLQNKDVLDVGAGSGILTIAADLLGAKSSHGVDIDAETLPVAEMNNRLNRARATFAFGTLQDEPEHSADVVVANLFAELHVTLAGEYRRVIRAEGQLLVTGILVERLESVHEVLAPSFVITDTAIDGEWALVKAIPKTAK